MSSMYILIAGGRISGSLAILLALATLTCLLSGCGGASDSGGASSSTAADSGSGDRYLIGYTVNDLNDTWVSVIIDNVQKWDAEHPEAEVLIGDGKSDVSTQMAVVEGWIEMGVDCV